MQQAHGFGAMAGKRLRLDFCARLNGSNSIQHLCLKSPPSAVSPKIGLQKKVNKMDKKAIDKEAIIADYLMGNLSYRKIGLKYGVDFRLIHS